MRQFQTIHVYGERLLSHISDQTTEALNQFELVILKDEAEFSDAIGNIEVLFGFKMPKDQWHRAHRLRLIQLPGAGADSLLPAKKLSDDVTICNAGGIHEPHMPEFVLAQLLSMSYGLPTLTRQQDLHQWRTSFPKKSLEGLTLCVVGLGTIGQGVARLANAMGMRTTGVRRSGADTAGVELVVTPRDRLKALTGADAVVVITPLTDETRGLIGPEELAALNHGSLLVDVSRGGVTDIDAVVGALASGQLMGAAMDVFEPEPLPEDSPLWDVPNLVISPHSAGLSTDYVDRLVKVLLTSMASLEAGQTPERAIDREAGY